MAITSRATITDIREINSELREFWLVPEKKSRYEAGQFLQFCIEEVEVSDYWPESRTFSIASYQKGKIRLIIKKVGKYTTRIFEELNINSVVTIKYAYGDFLLPFDSSSQIVCIAGGTGITPFLAFIDYLENVGGLDRMFLYYSAQTKQSMIDYEEIKEKFGDKVKFFTTREENENTINHRISKEDILIGVNTTYYVCGSEAFNDYYKRLLFDLGCINVKVDEW